MPLPLKIQFPTSFMQFMLMLLALMFAASAALAADRPNVILIMTDDEGYPDIGIKGNTILKTPNMDAMARRSAEMRHFYVSPVCTPTRACLMTGRYNYRTRAIDTSNGRAMMEPSEVTVAEVLHRAGWATGLFGKWHLGDNYPLRAQDHGFEEVLCIRGGGLAQPSDPPGSEGRYTDPILFHNGQPVPTHGYCTDLYFDAAMSWITKQRDAKRPFFVYIPTNAPHGPYHDVPPKWYDYYKKLKIDETTLPTVPGGQPLGKLTDSDTLARLYSMISNIDENVGRLFAKLDELKLTGDTLVFLMTDNGPPTHGYNAGLRGNKATAWEGGVRSFFFAHWPGRLPPGVASDLPVAHIDMLPTILEACGVAKPAGVKLDGRSFWPLLTGQKTDWVPRTLFFQSHRGDVPELYRNFAAQTAQWKLVSSGTFGGEAGAKQSKGPKQARKKAAGPTTARLELYHIGADEFELQDVAAQNPQIVEDLKHQYEAWFKDVSTTREDNYAAPRILLGTEHENPAVLSRQNWRGAAGGTGTPGFWEVTFTKPGNYGFKAVIEPPKQAGKLVIMVDDMIVGTVAVEPVAESAGFAVSFNAQQIGPGKLRAFVESGGEKRGVRFLEVSRAK